APVAKPEWPRVVDSHALHGLGHSRDEYTPVPSSGDRVVLFPRLHALVPLESGAKPALGFGTYPRPGPAGDFRCSCRFSVRVGAAAFATAARVRGLGQRRSLVLARSCDGCPHRAGPDSRLDNPRRQGEDGWTRDEPALVVPPSAWFSVSSRGSLS